MACQLVKSKYGLGGSLFCFQRASALQSYLGLKDEEKDLLLIASLKHCHSFQLENVLKESKKSKQKYKDMVLPLFL